MNNTVQQKIHIKILLYEHFHKNSSGKTLQPSEPQQITFNCNEGYTREEYSTMDLWLI